MAPAVDQSELVCYIGTCTLPIAGASDIIYQVAGSDNSARNYAFR